MMWELPRLIAQSQDLITWRHGGFIQWRIDDPQFARERRGGGNHALHWLATTAVLSMFADSQLMSVFLRVGKDSRNWR